jgi:competence protein ComEC
MWGGCGMVWVLAAALAAGITGDLRVVLGALFVFVVWVGRRRIRWLAVCVALVTAILFGVYGALSIGSLRYRTELFEAKRSDDQGRVVIEGWVSSFPAYRYGGMAYSLRTHLDGVECTVYVRSREYVVSYGDSLRVSGRLYQPKPDRRAGYARYLFGRGVCGEIRAAPAAVERLDGANGSWSERMVLWPLHDRLRRMANRSIGSRCGIAIALLLGEKGYLERGTRKAFVRLGISHLLALSGLHLGFVATAMLLIFRMARRRSGLALVGCLAVYVGVVGCIVSLYRAFVMAVVLVTAAGIKRPMDPLGALANAFVIVLLVFPYAFYSVGFQLSFLATLAVLLHVRNLSPPTSKGRAVRVWFWVRSSLTVSLAAQAIVAPLVLSYFGRMSLVSPLGTLLFVVPVGILLVGLGAGAVISLVIPGLEPVLFGGLGWFLDIFRNVLIKLASLGPDPAVLPVPEPWIYYAGVAMILVGRAGRWRKLAGVCVIGVSLCIAYTGKQLF